MLEIIAFLCLAGTLAVLVALSVIDLKHTLLPNKLVLAFLLLGVAFHVCTALYFASPFEMALGALIGGGALYLVRAAANAFYKKDALGLGDVKLLAAAGVWLGPHDILIAMSAGAFAGILHGGGIFIVHWLKTKKSLNLGALSLPAGPGFIIGIILTALYKYRELPEMLLGGLTS